MASEIEIAWAAGLFEGEGCICVYNRPARGKDSWRRGVTMNLTSTDRDVVEKFASVVGVGSVSTLSEARKAKPHHKDQFRWLIASAKDVETVIRLFLPHLCARRSRKAHEALEITTRINSKDYSKGPRRLEMCKRGLHALVGKNVKVSTSGKRRCRPCLNEWRRKNEKACG